MTDEWKVSPDNSGWIRIDGFGELNPRRDNIDGGRQYFDAKTSAGEFAEAVGPGMTGGPETWHFEFDQPFFIRDRDGNCREVVISPLPGSLYGVRSRPADWPGYDSSVAGGWADGS